MFDELTITRRDGSRHVVLFDSVDADLVRGHTWHIAVRNQVSYVANGKRQFMHSLVMGGIKHVDHVNHNGLDNRRANLRPASKAEQQANTRPPARAKTSPYKGVARIGPARWRVLITTDGRPRHVGCFNDEWEAALAYDKAATEAWGDYALTNQKMKENGHF